jgi:hypothetical protein
MRGRRRHAERIAIVALAVVTGSCGGDPPRLQVTALPGSAGAAAERDVVRVRYELRNGGGGPLAIDGVSPACGCRAAGELPLVLAPGAAATLAVDCRAPERVGETVRELRLRTSDPTSPATTLRVTLRNPAPGLVPAALYFGYVALGDSAVRDVVVPSAVSTAEVTASSQAELAVETLPPRPDGARGIRVRFTPSAPGVARATLDVGGTALRVTGVGYDRLIPYPAEIATPAPGRSRPESIMLVAPGAEPIALGRVEYPAGLTGDLKVVRPGRQWRLLVRGRAATGTAAPALIRVYDASARALLAIPVGARTGDAPAAEPNGAPKA